MNVDFGALFKKKRKLDSSGGPPLGSSKSGGSSSSSSAQQLASSVSKKRRRKKKKNQQTLPTPSSTSVPEALASSSVLVTSDGGGKKNKLARRMSAQLAGGQFRYINEQLYTRPSAEAVKLFAEEPRLYDAYHEGFRSQAARWPLRPVHAIAQWLRAQPPSRVVADLGCGDAELAESVPQRVHSFDLVAANERVVACDIASVPLHDASVDVAVFCLALMGSNFADFLREAHRLLRPKGILKIAEVSSRIDDQGAWDALLEGLGFDLREHDDSNSHFVMYEYVKSAKRAPERKLASVRLKPCAYKKR
jgi:ribosomal RNA-processing protein 8